MEYYLSKKKNMNEHQRKRGVRLGQELASEEGREAGNSLLEGICPHVLVPLLGRCNLEELTLRSQEPIIVEELSSTVIDGTIRYSLRVGVQTEKLGDSILRHISN
jgi:hypothetical protein